jgi:hypothetical protein
MLLPDEKIVSHETFLAVPSLDAIEATVKKVSRETIEKWSKKTIKVVGK